MATAKKPGSKSETPKTAAKAPSKTKKAAAAGSEVAQTAAPKAAKADKPMKAKGAPRPARGPLNIGTTYPKQGQESKWVLIDAAGQTLGRVSSYVSQTLMGKNKPGYTPFSDTGDFVIVINAKDVQLTGKKWEQKEYFWHTGYAGGIKRTSAKDLLKTRPERLIQRAVWGMLPKTRGHLVRRWYRKLKVYSSAEHPHTAQQPQPVTLPNLGAAARA